jgi:hypothetical protein
MAVTHIALIWLPAKALVTDRGARPAARYSENGMGLVLIPAVTAGLGCRANDGGSSRNLVDVTYKP